MKEFGKDSDINKAVERKLDICNIVERELRNGVPIDRRKIFFEKLFEPEIPEKEMIKTEKKGGRYGEILKEGEGDKYEVHHMPADSVTKLERYDGPAIKMEKDDHRQTASCGNSKEAREYRAEQKKLIDQGKFREALKMDIDDIHEKFGSKYDEAIDEMLDYVNELERKGEI